MKNLLFILFFLPLFALAQKTHTVAPKETLYSLGRLYSISPKELAAYNNLSIETGLTIGQVIKIPGKGKLPGVIIPKAEKPVVAVSNNSVPGKGTVPVYHVVGKKETLYRISKLYENITIEDIKKWNNLVGDGVTEGASLIVGYRKGNKSAAEIPVAIEEKKETVSKKTELVSQVSVNEKKEPTEKQVSTSSKVIEPVKKEEKYSRGKNPNGGFFKSLFAEQALKKNIVEETGTAAVFKSSSGWEDGKYYCLHNSASAGSIIKITNNTTGKSVYAKVLDVIPDLKQNRGVMIRISNAAADELGSGESDFEATLNY